MAKKIGISLYLDGASKFNSDIKQINSELQKLRSEMKLNSEEYKNAQNSAEALTAKSETLSKQYETASKKVEEYNKRIAALIQARDQEKEKLEQYNSTLEKEKAKLDEVERTSGKTSEAYVKQSAVVSELKTKVDLTESSISDLDKEEIRLETQLNNTTAEQIRYGAELEKTNGYLEEARQSADQTATSIDKYGKEAEDSQKQTEGLNDALTGIIRNQAFEKISEGAQKVVESLMDCAETAEKFEYAIAKVQSIARVSGDELENMSDDIRQVAVDMGLSANEVAEATYQAISASVDAADAIGFVADASKLARAGFTDVTSAVDVLTTATNAYGKEANTTAHIADDLITTQNLGKTTVNELAASLGTIIPTASAYGITLDQISSAYVILTRNGVNTANATTYLSGMMTELADNGSEVANVLYQQTGYSFGELSKQGYTLGDIMQVLGDYVDGDSESFANLFSNVRAGRGAMNLFNAGAEEFNRILGEMGNNAGATDEAFATMAETAVMTNERFMASAENLKIAIGEALSPTIDGLKKKGIDILTVITDFVDKNPGLVRAIGGAAAAVAGLTVAATAAATAIALFKAVLGDVSGIAVLATAGLAAGAGAFVGLTAGAESASKELAKANSELQKTHEATKEAAKATDTNIDRAKELAKRYEELAGKAHLNDEEFNELNSIITELNATIPGCSIAYRENADAIDSNTEAVKANIDALIEDAKQAANMEELTALYKEQAEAKRIVAEATENLTELERQQAEYDEKFREGIAGSAAEYHNLRMQISDATEAQSEAQGILDETTTKINELSEVIREETVAEQENIISKQAQEEAEKALSDAIAGASAAISDQIGLFKEWADESELTFAEMQDRWKEQNEGIKQYTDDLAYIKGVIDSEADPAIKDLAEDMVSMGVNGSAELHEFVEGLKNIDSNTDGLEALAKTWQEHIDNIKAAEDIYASITLQEQGYVEESNSLFAEYYAASEGAQEEHNKAIADLATKGVEEQAEAIRTTGPEVEEATRELSELAITSAQDTLGMSGSSSQSSRFLSIGKAISKSIADGISAEGGSVANALQTTLQNAANNIDVSGIAGRITSKLASALTPQINNEMAKIQNREAAR